MKKILISFSILFFIISCQGKLTESKKEKEMFTMNDISTDYDTLINRVKIKGDRDAYDEIFYYLMDSNKAERTDTLMIYSKIMAEKYNYDKAYFDYFVAFCEKHGFEANFSQYSNIDISKMEQESRKEATDWLNKMVNKKIISEQKYDSIKK